MIILFLILLIILIIFSAFFSSAETSFLSISSISLRQMQKNNVSQASLIVKLKSRTDKLLTTILIGNNFVNTLASSLATMLAIELIGQNGTGIATFIMAVLIIIFGEIVPKSIAAHKPEKIACFTASPLWVLEKIFAPVISIFNSFNKFINKLVNILWKDGNPSITEEELKTLIDVGNEEGTVDSGEKEMLYKIFEFTDLRVRDILKHRSLVKALPDTADYYETVNAFTKYGYSRLPVYHESIETITGIIHYKDVLFYTGNKEKFTIESIIRKAFFVPETVFVVSLLHSFKNDKQNFAVVVDEHGSNSGIVTMDDILKAVFGRITDEYNTKTVPSEQRIKLIANYEFLIPGDLPLNDINSIFNLTLSSEDCDTFGGWLLEKFGYLPDNGEKIREKSMLLTVESIAGRRIQKIKLRLDR